MADRWLSMAEAAAKLQISTRTLQRRIKQDRYQTQCLPDGRRQVCVPAAVGQVPNLADDQGDPGVWDGAAHTPVCPGPGPGPGPGPRRTNGTPGVLVAAALMALTVAGTWWTTRTVSLEQARSDQLAAQLEASSDRVHELADQVVLERRRADDVSARLNALTADAALLGAQCDRLAAALAAAEAANADGAERVNASQTWSMLGQAEEQQTEEAAPGG